MKFPHQLFFEQVLNVFSQLLKTMQSSMESFLRNHLQDDTKSRKSENFYTKAFLLVLGESGHFCATVTSGRLLPETGNANGQTEGAPFLRRFHPGGKFSIPAAAATPNEDNPSTNSGCTPGNTTPKGVNERCGFRFALITRPSGRNAI